MAKNTVQGGNPLEPIHAFDGATTGELIQSNVLVKEGTDSPLPSSVARGLVVDTSGGGLQTGRNAIVTAGSSVQINGGGSLACKTVMVVALPTNTLRVAVGGAGTDAADSTFQGIPLEPLQGIAIDTNNVNNVYFDALGDGHGITWTVIA